MAQKRGLVIPTSSSSGISLRMVRTFSAIMATGNATLAAHDLGQSQPAVSRTLRDLRTFFGDPLFVRKGAGLVPTEFALGLRDRMDHARVAMEALESYEADFNPRELTRRIRIQANNCLGSLFMPMIIHRIGKEAPNASVDFVNHVNLTDVNEDLSNGKLDIAIGNWPSPQEQMRYSPLLETPTHVMMRVGHALARYDTLSMERYLSAQHLSPTSSTAPQISPIDGRLKELGLSRDISISITEFALVRRFVERSDLVFTSSSYFISDAIKGSNCVQRPAPEEFGKMRFYLLWHERAHTSRMHQWLRNILRETAAEIRADKESRALGV